MKKKMKYNPKKERRTAGYHFNSLIELFGYFANALSNEEMDTVVRESAQGFIPRQGESEEITHLQFVKKCEYGMDTLAQLKEMAVYTGRRIIKESRDNEDKMPGKNVPSYLGTKYFQWKRFRLD